MKAVTSINGRERFSKVVMPDNFLQSRRPAKDSIVYCKSDAELITDMLICILNGASVKDGEARIKATEHVFEAIGDIDLK